MKKLLIQHRLFFVPYLLLLILATAGLIFGSKGDLVLWFNARYSPFWDTFFRYGTDMGDGTFIGILLSLLFLFKPRIGIAGTISTVITSVVIQFLKRSVFGYDRPLRYFLDRGQEINQVHGVELHSMFSFPSGHAGGAFAVFCVIALFSRKSGVNALLIILASIVALSRVYLAQHFLMDVYAGSVLGVIFSLTTVYLLKKNRRFSESNRLDQPFFGLFV